MHVLLYVYEIQKILLSIRSSDEERQDATNDKPEAADNNEWNSNCLHSLFFFLNTLDFFKC